MKKLIASFLCISSLLSFASPSEQSISLNSQKAQDAGVQHVDFLFCDIDGNLRNVTQPIGFLNNVMRNGTTFDGSSIPGYASINNSDLVLMPDPETFTIVNSPQEITSAAFITCDICTATDTPFESSPRFRLKQAMDRADAMGYKFLVGPELEFFVFKQGTTPEPCDSQKYFEPELSSLLRSFRREVLSTLTAQEIPVEKLHHEVAPGQHEISIKYDDAITTADKMVLAKHTIKSIAQNYGLRATFMPKPIYGQNGSGMHIHFSLYDYINNINIFADATDTNKLSNVAKHFIAGVLHYVEEIAALLNPTINSYKRLVVGYEAPTNICWGTKNRSALIRIPYVGDNQLAGVRAEIRCPDAMANPYLAFAALLHAGLDGIEQKMELSCAIERNLYHLSQNELSQIGVKSLPGSLAQALAFFSNSMLAQRVLGTQLHEQYVNLKTREIHAFDTAVTNWELNRYQ